MKLILQAALQYPDLLRNLEVIGLELLKCVMLILLHADRLLLWVFGHGI